MSVRNIFTDSSLQVGQELVAFVVNNTGVDIPDGKVVKVSGSDPVNDALEIELSIADNTDNALVLGFTTTAMADGEVGFVTEFGRVNELDTSLFGVYKDNGYSYSTNYYTQLVSSSEIKARVKKKQPAILKYAEPFYIHWDDDELEEIKTKCSYNYTRDIPTKFSYGEFQVIQVGTDPIIIANLKSNIYKVIGHVPTLPTVNGFEV